MKRVLITALAACAAAFIQSIAYAQQVDAKWAQAEAKEHGCLNCHAVDADSRNSSRSELCCNEVIRLCQSIAVHRPDAMISERVTLVDALSMRLSGGLWRRHPA